MANDQTIYLVIDCYGSDCVWRREADVEAADLETVIIDLLDGQYRDPRRVVAFNTAETWSPDVSGDVPGRTRASDVGNAFGPDCEYELFSPISKFFSVFLCRLTWVASLARRTCR